MSDERPATATPAQPRIRPLSDHLIDQIAAGEVIERPQSVVKELIENSLDAGARRIEVEVRDGGIETIVVSDDGHGMAGHELHAALRRHWTSKLGDGADLTRIASLGFRGEALASVAAVATVELTSRERAAAHGWRVTSVPGALPSAPVPCRAHPGTRIEVRELFHDVPARRRFLKRARTEYLHVLHVVRQLAFAEPAVALSLRQDGSRGLRLPAATYGVDSPRWRQLFGSAFVSQAVAVDDVIDDISVRGWVGTPGLTTNQSDLQLLVLNGRAIRDRQLAHAIRLAYGDSVPSGRFPQYALAVDVPQGSVDINVHPGKLEVRFADVRTVHDILFAAVRRALGGADPAAAIRVAEAPPTYIATTQSPRSAVARADAWFTRAPLALVDDRFLLARDGAAVRALDLRASWLHVLGRRLSVKTPHTRPLLLPCKLAASDPVWRVCPRPALGELGFDIDDLGPAGYLVRGVPRVLPDLEWRRMFDELARGNERIFDPAAHVARAAAAVIELGRDGIPARAALDLLAQAAQAVALDLDAGAIAVTAALLGRAR